MFGLDESPEQAMSENKLDSMAVELELKPDYMSVGARQAFPRFRLLRETVHASKTEAWTEGVIAWSGGDLRPDAELATSSLQ